MPKQKHLYFCQGVDCPGLPYPVPPAHWAFHPHTCGQGHTKPQPDQQAELVAAEIEANLHQAFELLLKLKNLTVALADLARRGEGLL